MPSSVVHTMRYDPDAKILQIIFVSGMIYDYLDVPEKVYTKMKEAPSKGTFLNRYIKTKYPFKKIG